MMRIFRLCLLVCCALSLTACLGSGGGGGGGGSGAISGGGGGGSGGSGAISGGGNSIMSPTAMYSDVAVAKESVEVKPGEDSPAALNGQGSLVDGGLAVNNSGSLKLYKTADPAISYTIDDSKVVLLENGVLKATYNANDSTFTAFLQQADHPDIIAPNTQFSSKMDEKPDGSYEIFDGKIQYTGDAVLTLYHETSDFKLDYSTFGAWALGYTAQGTVKEYGPGDVFKEEKTIDGLEEVEFIPIHGRVDGQYKAVPAAAKTFEGPITAMAYLASIDEGKGDNSFKNVFLAGTAKLNVVSPTAVNEINLILPGFYDIKYSGNNFVIDADGMLGIDEQSGQTPTFTPNNTTAGFEMKEIREHDIKAQFYGPSSSAASEATGQFRIIGVNDAHRQVGVRGAFGVK
jgi:hypothetical protein